MDNIDRLERLSRLRTEGAITNEEFEAQKHLILTPRSLIGKRMLITGIFLGLAIIIAIVVAILLTRGGQDNHDQTAAVETAQPISNLASAIENPPLAAKAANTSPEQDRTATSRWATSRDVLGSNPTYLEQRLGVPRVKDQYGLTFDLNGCEVNYSVERNSVKSFYARIDRDCRFNLNGRVITSQTTLGSLTRDHSRWQASCLALCGNAADPTVDVVEGGSRADGFVTISYSTTDYGAVSAWADAVERREGVGPFDVVGERNPFVNATRPPAEALPHLSAARIHSVTVERGF